MDMTCECNQGCLKKFSTDEIDANRWNVAEMDRSEKDLLIAGVLSAAQYDKEVAYRGRKGKHAFSSTVFKGRRSVLVHSDFCMTLERST